MERFIESLEPIQRAGVIFHKYAKEAGINVSHGSKMGEVELIFRKLRKLKSFRDFVDECEPTNENERVLIFTPLVKPEKSLCWVIQNNGLALPEKFDQEWKKKANDSPHYMIVGQQVTLCRNKDGDDSTKNDGHRSKPHV